MTSDETDNNTLDEIVISPTCRKFNLHNIITFDTESFRYDTSQEDVPFDEKQEMFNVDFFDGKQHYYTEQLDEVKELIEYLTIIYPKNSFVAHNIVYDLRILHLLTPLLREKFLNLDNKIRLMDKIFYLKYTSPKYDKVIQFMDSMNYFKTSLSELAETFTMKKLKEENYSLEPKEWNIEVKKEGKQRVQIDTEILYKAITTFRDMDFNLGITLASTSFNTFKKQYLKQQIRFPKELLDIALSAYNGGVTLAYNLVENKQLYDYDVNSLYPFVMFKYPYSVKYNKDINDYRYLYDDINNLSYNYLIKVRYKIDEYSPIYENYDNQLIPFLENEKWITSQEYVELYDNNAFIQILECKEFINSFIFKEFIETYYNRRLQAKTEYERLFLKLLMNSLYGKFGQHKNYSVFTLIEDLEDNPMTLELIYKAQQNNQRKVMIDGKFYSIYDNFVSVSKENNTRYNPLIAGEITGNARMINYKFSKIIGFNHIDYTDTDSFFTDKQLGWLEGKELGQLKLEKKGIFTIHSLKDYEFYGICNSKKCKYCHGDEDAKHLTIKGVHDIDSIINDTYVNKIWSKTKYPINDDVYIQFKEQILKRLNRKLNYVNGEGKEWLNKDEYNAKWLSGKPALPNNII